MGWDRAAALEEVSTSLWRYLSRAGRPEAIATAAERIWDLPVGDVRRLVAAHLLVSDETSEMLSSVGQLLQRMPASTQFVEEELVGRVHGPVDWNRTSQLRLASGDRTRFICLPPDRSYDTSLARLVSFALWAAQRLHMSASLRGSAGDFGRRLTDIEMLRRRLAGHVKLDGIRPSLPNLRELAALSRRRHTGPLIRFARTYVDGFEQLNPGITRSVIERQLLVPSADDALFELLVVFRLIRHLESFGFELLPVSLIEPGSDVPLASLKNDTRTMRIWWQRGALPLVGITDGLYSEALTNGGMARSSLRPDFILEFDSPHHLVLVEVKHTVLEKSPVHAGVKDALLYLMDAREHFDHQPWPHALVVAEGAQTRAVRGRVIVSGGGRDELAAALEVVLADLTGKTEHAR